MAEVRSCSTDATPSSRRGPDERASGTAAVSTAPSAPRPAATQPRSTVVPPGIAVNRLAGPRCLGRSVVVGPGQAVPEPWASCREIPVDAHSDEATVDELLSAWRHREAIVIRWDGDGPPPPGTLDQPFHELGPASNPPGDRLHFAVTANAVDLLGPKPRFDPLARALAAGASVDDALAADGGPLDLDLAAHPDFGGHGYIPRCHLLVGSIRALSPSGPDEEAGIGLAPDQQAAVTHPGGPARILAPAGSGKTRVLTERVRHLVDQRGIDPVALSLVAYNRRARTEMWERLGTLNGTRPDSIRTLNSLALAITTGRSGFVGGTPATTIDERDVRRILGRLVPSRRRRQLNDPLESWVDALAVCRLGLLPPDEVADRFGGDVDGFGEVLPRYRQHLRDRNLVDFDEQVLRAVEILAADPVARETARRLMPIILIDEFQDLTPAHLLLVRLLAGPASEVFAVGDDDQTIYGYSGASPRWLVDFDRYFGHGAGASTTDYFLTTNYRCPAPVVDAAVNLLSHNRQRVSKTITAGPGRSDERSSLAIHRTGDPQQNLADHVASLLGRGAEPSDIAVLARVHAALLPAFIHLDHIGVPVRRTRGIDPSMLERSGSGAALAWLRLATAPDNGLADDDLRLALRRPPRSLHPRIVDWVCEQPSVAQLHRLAERLNTERDSASVKGLADDIAELRSRAADPTSSAGTTEALLDHILNDIGLMGAATALDGSQRTARRAAHGDELLALLAVARLHPDPATFGGWLSERLGSALVENNGDMNGDGDVSAVTLATIHATKGLEWPHVVVHDVRDGLYPHRLADDTEEERRIFHVAVTRGRDSVAITCSGPRSPFLDELTEARTEPWPAIDAPSPSTRRSNGAASPGGRTGSGSGSAGTTRAEPASETEAGLRESLTRWRRERAKDDAVPAYVVLNNRTLDAIARAEPRTLGELASVPGIGPSRLEQYGDEILGIVAAGIDG